MYWRHWTPHLARVSQSCEHDLARVGQWSSLNSRWLILIVQSLLYLSLTNTSKYIEIHWNAWNIWWSGWFFFNVVFLMMGCFQRHLQILRSIHQHVLVIAINRGYSRSCFQDTPIIYINCSRHLHDSLIKYFTSTFRMKFIGSLSPFHYFNHSWGYEWNNLGSIDLGCFMYLCIVIHFFNRMNMVTPACDVE